MLFGHCDEHAVVPFQPFVEALNHVVTFDPYALSAGELSGDLAVLFPQIASRIAAVSPPGLDLETQRYRMFEAVDQALGYLAGARPVVVIVDDLHWADHSTLLLLRHLTRSVPSRRLCIVAAFRDTAPGGSELHDEVAAMRRRSQPIEFALTGLTAADIELLLEAQAGHELGDDGTAFAAWLQREDWRKLALRSRAGAGPRRVRFHRATRRCLGRRHLGERSRHPGHLAGGRARADGAPVRCGSVTADVRVHRRRRVRPRRRCRGRRAR